MFLIKSMGLTRRSAGKDEAKKRRFCETSNRQTTISPILRAKPRPAPRGTYRPLATLRRHTLRPMGPAMTTPRSLFDPLRPFRLVTLDVPDEGVVQVLIVAADPLVRTGLATLFADQDGYVVAGSADVTEDLAAAVATYLPDVILWDPGFRDASSLEADELREAGVPVVALLPDAALAAEAWHAGAQGLLLRDASPQAIATTIVATRQGLVVVDPLLAETILPLPSQVPWTGDLTPREAEVLHLMAEGLPNKLIADRLGISPHTVKFHINAILGKLGVHSRTEAVTRAARSGLLVL